MVFGPSILFVIWHVIGYMLLGGAVLARIKRFVPICILVNCCQFIKSLELSFLLVN